MSPAPLPDPTFFPTPAAFGAWLRTHHAKASELIVGYHKKESGKPSMTWPESVDEALCYGWIDGIRRAHDADSYTIRFTPRKPTSIWSDVNTAKAKALIAEGRMQPSGLRAFEARDEKRAGIYAFENKSVELSAAELAAFRKSRVAWKFWESQAAGYRRTASHWVASAKRAETRARRFATLVEDSAAGLRIAQLRR